MAQSGQHCYLLLAPVSDETLDSPRLNLEKTSCSRSAQETTRNKNRGYFRGTVVKTFGRIYSEFFTDQKKYRARKRGLEGTRGAHEAGGAPRGVGPPSTLMEASCPSQTASYFPIFLNIPKQSLLLELFWSQFTYNTTYLFLFGIWNVLESVPYILLRGYGVNNIGFNIYGITWDIVFDSLTVYHLRICAFEVVDFYSTGTIDLEGVLD